MRKFLTASAAALALAGTTLGAAAPAEARWHGGGYGWRGGYYRGNGAGIAVGAGLLGLAAGAAIASRPYYGGYYGYPGYAAPPPAYGYGYDYPGYCQTNWRWDGWRGRYVPVRYCD